MRRFTAPYRLLLSVLIMLLAVLSAHSGTASGEQPTVANVEDQFRNLQRHGDGLASWLGEGATFYNWPDWKTRYGPCKHYQGIARMDVEGTPYFFLTRSGVHTGACPGASDNPAELLVVQMGSRNALGERLRSNRLSPRWKMDDTLPPATDRGVKSVIFGHTDDNGDLWPLAMHTGGMQLIDGVLLIPLDTFCPDGFKPNDVVRFRDYSPASDDCIGDHDPDSPQGSLLLVDVQDPENPRLIREFGLGVGGEAGFESGKTDAVAVTRDPSTGLYLLATIEDYLGNGNKALVFRSSTTDDLRSEDLSWTVVGWDPSPDWGPVCTARQDCLAEPGFGMINFVRQDDGALYLIGSDNNNPDEPVLFGYDFLRVFKVNEASFCHPSKLADCQEPPHEAGAFHEYIAQRTLRTEDPQMGNCKAACGVYVSPSGELIVYTAHHDVFPVEQSCEVVPPLRLPICFYETSYLPLGEFRHIDVTHDRKLEVVDVDEDGRFEDSCSGWVELYEAANGWEEEIGGNFNDSPRSLMFDFRDRHLDNWEDLREYNQWEVCAPFCLTRSFNDVTSAFRWNLPPGQSAWLYRDSDFEGDSIELTGRGKVEDLSQDPNYPGWNDEISSVRIGPVADPGGPYAGAKDTPISLGAANPCYEADSPVSFAWDVDSPSCELSDRAARRPSIDCKEPGVYSVTLTVTDMTVTDPSRNSAEASVGVTVPVFPFGKALLVKQKKSGRQRLQLLAKDADVLASQPCGVDGELVVEAGDAGSPVRVPLAAGLWKPLNRRKPERGCRYRDRRTKTRVTIEAGGRIKVVAKGDLVPLAEDPRPVRIALRHGEIQHCFEFGGSAGAYKPGRRLIARNAAPAANCPESGGVQ